MLKFNQAKDPLIRFRAQILRSLLLTCKMLKKKKENFSRKVISYALALNSPIYQLKRSIKKGYENMTKIS